MYPQDDPVDHEAVGMLESNLPNLHKVLAQHYRDRIQQVINLGRKYTPEYFLIRNTLRYHEKQC